MCMARVLRIVYESVGVKTAGCIAVNNTSALLCKNYEIGNVGLTSASMLPVDGIM